MAEACPSPPSHIPHTHTWHQWLSVIIHAATHRGKLNQTTSSFTCVIYFVRLRSRFILSSWPMSHVDHEHFLFFSCSSSHRAFRINELKTEVTNRLAMLEKRVERKWCIYSLNERIPERKIPFRCNTTRGVNKSWNTASGNTFLKWNQTLMFLIISFQWRAWRWWRLRSVKMIWRSYGMRWLQEVAAGEMNDKVRCLIILLQMSRETTKAK